MKLMWFHLMPYTELPDNFRDANPSVWVDIHSSLFDPKRAHLMYNDFMDELEYAAEVRVRRDLRERAPFQWLRPDAVAEPDRLVAGAPHHGYGDLRDGQLAGAVQSADARGGRVRNDRLISGGRLIAGSRSARRWTRVTPTGQTPASFASVPGGA